MFHSLFVICFSSLLLSARQGSISTRDASRINKLIHKAGTITGQSLEPFESVRDRTSLNKMLSIMDNPSQLPPLHTTKEAELLIPLTDSTQLP